MLLQLIRGEGRTSTHVTLRHRARRAAVDRPRDALSGRAHPRGTDDVTAADPARTSPGRTRAARRRSRRRPDGAHDPAREGRPALRRLGRDSTTRAQASRRTSTSSRPRRSTGRADPHGIGQLTRPFGTAPVDPAIGARGLAATPARDRRGGPLRHPRAGARGVPDRPRAPGRRPSTRRRCRWGASFDPELVERMGAQIGRTMRRLGIHQGLAPVLDVVRDLRWGRVEETIGEDPYLVGTIGSAYVRGPGVRRRRRHPQALRRLLRLARPGATSRRCRSGRASSPTCCCRRSRWRCAPAPAR